MENGNPTRANYINLLLNLNYPTEIFEIIQHPPKFCEDSAKILVLLCIRFLHILLQV